MQKKNSLLYELNKTWSLARVILENDSLQQGQRAPQQGQRAPQTRPQQPASNPKQPNVTSPQEAQKNIANAMDQGMSALIQQLPSILKNFTSNAGDKDNQLDLPGQNNVQQTNASQNTQTQQQVQQQTKPQVSESTLGELKFNEEKFKSNFKDLNEGGIIGMVASAPAILQLGSKLLNWTGKKANIQFLQKWGNSLAGAGEKLHHKYIDVLEKAISPFMKNATPKQKHQAAEALFMGLVAALFAGGITSPNILTGIKGQELASYAGKIALNTLGNLGFA